MVFIFFLGREPLHKIRVDICWQQKPFSMVLLKNSQCILDISVEKRKARMFRSNWWLITCNRNLFKSNGQFAALKIRFNFSSVVKYKDFLTFDKTHWLVFSPEYSGWSCTYFVFNSFLQAWLVDGVGSSNWTIYCSSSSFTGPTLSLRLKAKNNNQISEFRSTFWTSSPNSDFVGRPRKSQFLQWPNFC